MSSPRSKIRENAKDTLCRNVMIYGHCRYEEKGCAFNHSPSKPQSTQNHRESVKTRLNVDSPSFTPFGQTSNGIKPTSKPLNFSPKAANAVPFRPKGSTTASPLPSSSILAKSYNPKASDWLTPDAQEFHPQALSGGTGGEKSTESSHQSYGQYQDSSHGMPSQIQATPQAQINTFAHEDHRLNGASYFPHTGNAYSQPLQYHLYAALGPHREKLQSNQRTAKDFFIPEDLRQALQRKSEATVKTFSNLTLPDVEQYHSLVSLDHAAPRNEMLFGYPAWTYKAVKADDGLTYCLRRLEGYKPSNQTLKDILSIQQNWKRIRNGSVVSVHLAFTNSGFGKPSLFFATDFHPLSETLAQKHFQAPVRFANRNTPPQLPEKLLWHYVVQIGNALRAIHSAGLAARVIDTSKILITEENRLRLNGCAIMDVLQGSPGSNLLPLQIKDFALFGEVILALGSGNLSTTNEPKALELFRRTYSPRLLNTLNWLKDHDNSEKETTEGIDYLLANTAVEITTAFDASIQLQDMATSNLARELENSRIVRLLIKFNTIVERPEYDEQENVPWSEHGSNRLYVKLFRDFVFHQVDSQGQPVLDLSHVLACLNKLDAGTDERIMLTTRDEETKLIVTYKEVKGAVMGSYEEIVRRANTIG